MCVPLKNEHEQDTPFTCWPMELCTRQHLCTSLYHLQTDKMGVTETSFIMLLYTFLLCIIISLLFGSSGQMGHPFLGFQNSSCSVDKCIALNSHHRRGKLFMCIALVSVSNCSLNMLTGQVVWKNMNDQN